MVVDDEAAVRMLIVEVAEDLGHTAFEAADAAAGLRLLDSDVRIDLLITDIGLPGGMTGRQLANVARATRPGLQVLFISGYADYAALPGRQLKPGKQALTKPFTLDALAQCLQGMLASEK